jgi:MFS transporter, PHS family, inorganic phosphate transporter
LELLTGAQSKIIAPSQSLFYAFTQFFFYLGPNAMTFIIAAELFPTSFRCTCHGISAAAGKLGSIVAQIVLAYSPVPGNCAGQKCHVGNPRSTWLGWMILIFSIPMAMGCFITYMWLPELQWKDGPRKNEPKSLEDLTEKQSEGRWPGTARESQV